MKTQKNWCLVLPKMTGVESQTYMFPIGIAYVCSALKQTKRKVVPFNLNYKQGSVYDILKGVIEDNEIDVIATGGLTAQYNQLYEILKAAKKIKPEIITVAGGGIITSDPNAAMEALEHADYGIIGEGEHTICELADALDNAEFADRQTDRQS